MQLSPFVVGWQCVCCTVVVICFLNVVFCHWIVDKMRIKSPMQLLLIIVGRLYISCKVLTFFFYFFLCPLPRCLLSVGIYTYCSSVAAAKKKMLLIFLMQLFLVVVGRRCVSCKVVTFFPSSPRCLLSVADRYTCWLLGGGRPLLPGW